MKIIKADKEIPVDKEDLVHLINSILLYYNDHKESIDKELKKSIESLPSEYMIEHKLSDVEIHMLYKIIRNIWKKITGQELDNVKLEQDNEEKRLLSGNYWMLPGSILLAGFNHFSIAKKHKGIFCSVLGLNPWLFEKFIVSDPDKLIFYIISNGGIRMNVDKDHSIVICQTNEDSFPWVRNKLMKMYHQTKVAKIIDLKSKYEGWKSGINMVINSKKIV
jgi:hypothetical protein